MCTVRSRHCYTQHTYHNMQHGLTGCGTPALLSTGVKAAAYYLLLDVLCSSGRAGRGTPALLPTVLDALPTTYYYM